eukprot:211128-Chlamydomonas_euryale.AAC.7
MGNQCGCDVWCGRIAAHTTSQALVKWTECGGTLCGCFCVEKKQSSTEGARGGWPMPTCIFTQRVSTEETVLLTQIRVPLPTPGTRVLQYKPVARVNRGVDEELHTCVGRARGTLLLRLARLLMHACRGMAAWLPVRACRGMAAWLLLLSVVAFPTRSQPLTRPTCQHALSRRMLSTGGWSMGCGRGPSVDTRLLAHVERRVPRVSTTACVVQQGRGEAALTEARPASVRLVPRRR